VEYSYGRFESPQATKEEKLALKTHAEKELNSVKSVKFQDCCRSADIRKKYWGKCEEATYTDDYSVALTTLHLENFQGVTECWDKCSEDRFELDALLQSSDVLSWNDVTGIENLYKSGFNRLQRLGHDGKWPKETYCFATTKSFWIGKSQTTNSTSYFASAKAMLEYTRRVIHFRG